MSWAVALRLGRVSNLPTVWTNVLAATVLAGSTPASGRFALLLLAFSLFYLAGMYLNDAFDRHFDASAYPGRPIPSGVVSARTVFTVGFLGLGAGGLLLGVAASGAGGAQRWPPLASGLCLAATIVFYDMHHKQNPFGPLLMSLCRALVYLTVALAVAPSVSFRVWWGAGLLSAYVVGLSGVAKQETLARPTQLWPLACLAAPFAYGAAAGWQGPAALPVYAGFLAWVSSALWSLLRRSRADIRESVLMLIAGIALLDALLIALAGEPLLAGLAAAGALLTRAAHRLIPGT